MNYSDIQHRFANKLEGKNGCIKTGNVRYEGRNFYSYSTVFGQWVDVEKNVVVIFDGSTSPSSNRHMLWKGLFPDVVHTFPYNDNRGGWYSYDGCDIMGWEREFTFKHRCILIEHYVEHIYNQIAAINGGKKKGLENVSFEAWGYIEELCSLYKDTSINKYLKWTNNKDYKKLVKLLKDGERNVQVLTDALFGDGTYKTYWDYCARFRKAADKRAKVEALCERLGIASPYDSYSRGRMDTGLTADQIRKMTAKERVELHFKALAYKEYEEHENERKKLYNKRKDNAYRWIVGFEPIIESEYSHSYKDCQKVRNKYTGEVYEVGGSHIFGFWWAITAVDFDYDEFRKSDNKEEWMRKFYAEVKEAQENRTAIKFLKQYGVLKEKQNSYDDDIYIGITDEGRATGTQHVVIAEEFIRRQDAYFAEKERVRRARELQRQREKEEEERERAYREQVKQEQIDECLGRGVEGRRDLWRLHLTDIWQAEREGGYKDDFYMGGNVLLRLNLNKDKVETSKNIRIPVEVCKKMWKIVSKWHENPACFKPMQIDTKGSGKYTISSYEDDILTAGCHKIAYVEMERMYNEIINA